MERGSFSKDRGEEATLEEELRGEEQEVKSATDSTTSLETKEDATARKKKSNKRKKKKRKKKKKAKITEVEAQLLRDEKDKAQRSIEQELENLWSEQNLENLFSAAISSAEETAGSGGQQQFMMPDFSQLSDAALGDNKAGLHEHANAGDDSLSALNEDGDGDDLLAELGISEKDTHDPTKVLNFLLQSMNVGGDESGNIHHQDAFNNSNSASNSNGGSSGPGGIGAGEDAATMAALRDALNLAHEEFEEEGTPQTPQMPGECAQQ